MNKYLEATCVGKPMGLPEYDEEAEQWVVFFEESPTPWNPYAERDMIAYHCEDSGEACGIYNYYNQNPIKLETHDDEENDS